MARTKEKNYKRISLRLEQYVFNELDYFSRDLGIDRTKAIEMLLDKAIEDYYLERGQTDKLNEIRTYCEQNKKE